MVNTAMTLQSPTSTQSTNTPAFLLREEKKYQKLAQWEMRLYSPAFKEKKNEKASQVPFIKDLLPI